MSAPTKDEQLEEFAESIGMNADELAEFCKTVLEDDEVSDHLRFERDMRLAGFETRKYEGRNMWRGPAVYSRERLGPTRAQILAASTVECQWDNLGHDWVVYPLAVV